VKFPSETSSSGWLNILWRARSPSNCDQLSLCTFAEQKTEQENFLLAPLTLRFSEEERKLSGETQTRSMLEIEQKRVRAIKRWWKRAKSRWGLEIITKQFCNFYLYSLAPRVLPRQPASQGLPGFKIT
jgi:hypothetical protein